MISGELKFWRDLAVNLLTEKQLDRRMPNSDLSAREVLGRIEQDKALKGERCPYCSFDPTSNSDYCNIHHPISIKKPENIDFKSEFLRRTKGIPAYLVARALSNLTPGHIWSRCSKGLMAECWARSQLDCYSHNDRTLRAVTLNTLLKEIARIIP